MQRALVLFGSLLSACAQPSAAPAPAPSPTSGVRRSGELEVRFDEPRGMTVVRVVPPTPLEAGRTHLLAGATYPGRQARPPEEVLLGLQRSGPEWRYESCRRMAWLADGTVVHEGELSRDTQLGGGSLIEIVTVGVPFAAVGRLGGAARVEVVLCGETIALGDGERSLLRALVGHLATSAAK